MLTSGAHSSVPPFHPRIKLLCFLQKPRDAYKSQQKLTRLLSLSREEIKLAFHSEKKFENAKPNTLTALSRLNFRRPSRVSQSCGQGGLLSFAWPIVPRKFGFSLLFLMRAFWPFTSTLAGCLERWMAFTPGPHKEAFVAQPHHIHHVMPVRQIWLDAPVTLMCVQQFGSVESHYLAHSLSTFQANIDGRFG